MLIYNHKQEFIGIDEKDLKSLGFQNLAELKRECSDFADLFVKKPSYIHNFKNFNWIYYILHSDIGEAKVIIRTSKKNFTATLELETIYLNDAPDQPAYAITLSKLRALDTKENKDIEKDILETPAPKIVIPEKKVEEILPDFEDEQSIELSEPDIFETPIQQKVIEDPYDFDFNAPLDIEDVYEPAIEDEPFKIDEDFEFDQIDKAELPIDIYEENEIKESIKEPVEQKPVEKPMLGDYTATPSNNQYIKNLQVSKDYKYDPSVASSELGLPIDLIEEFIGDFIQQSYDFKDDLYKNVLNDDLEAVKLLSHKLKGVAANLRIEDAFEVLSIINSSDNMDEIRANLDHFYTIIAKLEGKAPILTQDNVEPLHVESIEEIPQEELYTVDLKDDLEDTQEHILEESSDEDDLYHIGIKYDDNEPITLENHNFDEKDDFNEKEQFKDDDKIALEEIAFDDDYFIKDDESTENKATFVENEDDFFIKDDNLTDDTDSLVEEDEPIKIDEELSLEDINKDDYLNEESNEIEEDAFIELDELTPVENDNEDDFFIKDDNSTDDIDNLIEEDEPIKIDEESDETEEENPVEKEDNIDYDKDIIMHELGLNKDIVNQLLADFKEHSIDMMPSLEKAIEQSDFTELKSQVISIKGASDNLRLNKVSRILEELLSVDNVEDAKELLVSFKNYINQI
ncbi:hypothetical protein KKA17_00285 [bacterium]|nr:hypothetical protein [bacterium]MBU1883619.1 hypothetical protein [bacterium]